MDTRKEMKAKAKKVLKKHYAMYIALCFIAAIMGTEFVPAFMFNSGSETSQSDSSAEEQVYSGVVSHKANDIYELILADQAETNKEYQAYLKEKQEHPTVLNKIFGHQRGVLASVVNGVNSGGFATQIIIAVRNMTGSKNVAIIIFILGSLGLSFSFWYFIKNTFQVVIRRFYLEGRVYEHLSKQRFLYLVWTKRIFKVAFTMFLEALYSTLWAFTIVAIPIKHYSYKMLPFIVAENPDIKGNEAITLSRQMMNGHKWEYFKNDMTFFGWFLLGGITLGISDVFFTSAYRAAYFTECYVNLRKEAKEKNIPNADKLNDVYLFEKADEEKLKETYVYTAEFADADLSDPEEMKKGGIKAFFANWLGITFYNKKVNDEYEEKQVMKLVLDKFKAELSGKAYPTRLFTISEGEVDPNAVNVNFMRIYTLPNVILMFFTFSFIGWLWEVSLHLVTDGVFVNRGVLHGPWLPIYGMGGVLIILVLKKLRFNPIIEFVAAIVLSGILEYFTAFYLEITHNGKKWWDYSGYFLNLHGRICAEGLLIFGIAGMFAVYFAAPMFDGLYKRINPKATVGICAALLLIFGVDQVYSKKHPNEGKGITDYKPVGMEVLPSETMLAENVQTMQL